MMNLKVMSTIVMELPKILRKKIICWCLSMLKMEIYIIIYQRILKKLPGKTKLVHFMRFHLGKDLILLLLDLIFLYKHLVK